MVTERQGTIGLGIGALRPPIAEDAERIKAERANQLEGRGPLENQEDVAGKHIKPAANEDTLEVVETGESQDFIPGW